MSQELYTDGGVININPSPIGGTLAYCLVDNGSIINSWSGVVVPGDYKTHLTISNNFTEFLAVVLGLKSLPHDWHGTVFSDSQVTIGRITGIYKSFHGLTPDAIQLFVSQRSRLNHFRNIEFVLVGGHPTLSELDAGRNRKGQLVSKYNVWCDKACSTVAKEYTGGKIL